MSAIKKFFTVLIALSFGLSVQSFAQFQSDSEVKRNFDRDIADANQAVRTIQSVAQADSLLDVINNIPAKYSDNTSFLDRVMHPNTVRSTVQNLRDLAQVTRERIRRIEQQGENVTVLEQRISELSDSVSDSNEELQRLREQLNQATRARNVNAARARDFSDALRERDEFILQLIDSVFVAYSRVDLASLSAAERRQVALELDPENVFGHIESVIANNVDFLNTHTQLSSEDFLRLYSVQAEFKRMWDNLGSRLSELYVDTDRSARVRAISREIDGWGSTIDNAVWQSVAASFSQREIEMQSFSSAASFNAALNSFLNTAIERAREGGSEEEYARYQQFANVWNNDVKSSWQEYLIDAGLMSYRDFVAIDQQVSEWKVLAQPQSYAFMIYLGLALVIIIVLTILYLKEKGRAKA